MADNFHVNRDVVHDHEKVTQLLVLPVVNISTNTPAPTINGAIAHDPSTGNVYVSRAGVWRQITLV